MEKTTILIVFARDKLEIYMAMLGYGGIWVATWKNQQQDEAEEEPEGEHEDEPDGEAMSRNGHKLPKKDVLYVGLYPFPFGAKEGLRESPY